MKMLAVIPLLAMLYSPVSAPVPEQYPVHFHTVYVHSFYRQNSHHGSGMANVSEDGQPTRGFQFTFDSCAYGPFPHEMSARWIGEHHLQLAVQRTNPGANTSEDCILNGRLKDFTYEKVDGKPTEVPLAPPKP